LVEENLSSEEIPKEEEETRKQAAVGRSSCFQDVLPSCIFLNEIVNFISHEKDAPTSLQTNISGIQISKYIHYIG
jgi:hypothetical protein